MWRDCAVVLAANHCTHFDTPFLTVLWRYPHQTGGGATAASVPVASGEFEILCSYQDSAAGAVAHIGAIDSNLE